MTDTGELERLVKGKSKAVITVRDVSRIEPGLVTFMGKEYLLQSINERADGDFDLVLVRPPFAALEGKG